MRSRSKEKHQLENSDVKRHSPHDRVNHQTHQPFVVSSSSCLLTSAFLRKLLSRTFCPFWHGKQSEIHSPCLQFPESEVFLPAGLRAAMGVSLPSRDRIGAMEPAKEQNTERGGQREIQERHLDSGEPVASSRPFLWDCAIHEYHLCFHSFELSPSVAPVKDLLTRGPGWLSPSSVCFWLGS